MARRQHIGRWASAVCALTINLCAAAPPDDGLTVGGAAGYGQYSYSSGGCGAPVYRNEADDLRAHARAQVHSREDHWSVSLEGSYGQGEVTASELVDEGNAMTPPDEDPEQIGATKRSYAAALRGGAHWRYGGAEVGPLVYGGNLFTGEQEGVDMNFLFSASAWVGVPEYVYAWSTFFSGPVSPTLAPIMLGLGHKGEVLRARASLGVGSSDSTQLLGQLDVKLPLDQPLWLGVMAHSDTAAEHGVWLTIEVPIKID